MIRSLVAAGTTVFLTTQDMEEADQLANQIAVIDRGRVIAAGTSDELKAQIGGERLELTHRRGDLVAAVGALRPHCSGEVPSQSRARQHLVAPLAQGAEQLAAVVRDLDAAGLALVDLALRRPTLDDVFLSLTGRPSTSAGGLADAMPGEDPR